MTGRLMLLAVCVGSLVSLSLVASGQDAAGPAGSQVPKVELSAQHKAMVKVGVGQEFPAVKEVADGLGTKATVVAVWKGDGAMAKAMLRDLGVDVAGTYKSSEVTTYAIATGMPVAEAQEQATTLKYTGPVVADEAGETFASLGTDRLPRIYVLDAKGNVVWMDIEYSQSSRRELKQALAALVK